MVIVGKGCEMERRARVNIGNWTKKKKRVEWIFSCHLLKCSFSRRNQTSFRCKMIFDDHARKFSSNQMRDIPQ